MKIKILKIITCFTLALAVVLSCVPLTAYATGTTSTKKYVYNLTVTKITNSWTQSYDISYSASGGDTVDEYKYEVQIESDYPCVASTTYNSSNKYGQYIGTLPDESSSEQKINFYTLNSSNNVINATLKVVRVLKYNRDEKVWQLDSSNTTTSLGNSLSLTDYYIASHGSDGTNLKCLYMPQKVTTYAEDGTYKETAYNATQNIQSFLLTGKLVNVPEDGGAYALGNTSKIQFSKFITTFGQGNSWAYGPTMYNVKINDDGVVTWDMPMQTEPCLYKGVQVTFVLSKYNCLTWYRTVPMDNTFKLNIPKNAGFTHVVLTPYYVTQSGRYLPFSNAPKIALNKNASYYQGDGSEPLIFINERQDSIPSGVIPDADFDGGSGENDDFDSDISSDGTDEIGAPSEAEMKSFLDSTGKVGSLGYLQGVTYKEENHTLSSRTATISWSTSKEIPNARIQIASRNLYGTWTSQKIGMYVYKDYNDGVKYSTGSITFTAQDACEKWCKQNNYDISLASLTHRTHYTTDYYIRAVVYDETTGQYNYGGWVRIDVKQANSTQLAWTNTETGKWDDETGKWESDTESDDSYSYETGSDGTVMDDVLNMDNINLNAFTWLWGNVKNVVSTLGDFPFLISSVFGFIPSEVIGLISVLLGVTVLLRFVGR